MKSLLLASLPVSMEFYAQPLALFQQQHGAAFNLARLNEYTHQLITEGCEHVMDFRVILVLPAGAPPQPLSGFARLFRHPTRHFFAEVNQVMAFNAPPMSCNVASQAAPDWSLETTSTPPYAADSILYAMRRPHALWNRQPQLAPRELISLHLRQRDRVFGDVEINIERDLTWEKYRERELQTCHARRRRVENSFALQLMWDIFFSKGKMFWWGEYGKKFSNGIAALKS